VDRKITDIVEAEYVSILTILENNFWHKDLIALTYDWMRNLARRRLMWYRK
jgi:hypothetical protein